MADDSDDWSDRIPPMPCGLCNGLPAGGSCFDYVCFPCRYLANEDCAKLPNHKYFHPLHVRDGHSLVLDKRPSLPDTTRCYYCNWRIDDDFGLYSYGCDRCSDFYMHVACAMIPVPTLAVDAARFACHRQAMTLVDDAERHHHWQRWARPCSC